MRRFFLQQNDNRTNYIKQKLQEKKESVFDFETNMSKVKKEDIVIVTPAFKWSEDHLKSLPQGTTIFGGMYKDELQPHFKKLNYINFMLNENFVLENAKFTAEAFLVDLIGKTKLSLYNQKILVLGSGRVAKALWIILTKLGVNFDLSMRNIKEINLAKLVGNKVFPLNDLKENTKHYDTIINTIPFELFKNFYENDFKEGVNIFELASKKCLDTNKFSHINYIFCPSLPSKYLGDSAGQLMLEYILKIIEK